MSTYYYAAEIGLSFEDAIERVTDELKKEGFGVLTQIDVQATMKKKLDADMPPYLILGACNPQFAYQALQAEDKIGTMLPCNVIVKEDAGGRVEIAAVDPIASMQAVDNEKLGEVAAEVKERLKRVVDAAAN
jgi:uncharacterized protein (DUF302 family)